MKPNIACLLLMACCTYVLPAVAQESDASLTNDASAARQSTTAVVPRLIKVSGKVLDNAGYPVKGPMDVTFAFYEDGKSSKVLWKETQHVTLDDAGRYSILLGSATEQGVPLSIFASGEARWLGVHPEGMQERPRVLLLSVPFALKAGDAETLGGRPASAYALANPASGALLSSAPQSTGAPSKSVSPLDAIPCVALTSDGAGNANQIVKFTSSCNIENSAIYESNGLVGIGTTSPSGTLDVSGNSFFRGLLQLTPLGTASGGGGFNSNALDLQASSFNGSSGQPSVQDFLWVAEPSGSGSGNPSASLNLLFGSNGGSPSETGLSIQSNGVINFASGQTFPNSGSNGVTNIGTGAGLIGGPITSTGSISVAPGGITNSMIATPSITVATGAGLSGGGTVPLGGTITLTSTAQGTGTVTNINTGSGLMGGPITNAGTIGVAPGGITNTMLADPFIAIKTGTGLSGGGTVGLGGTITLSSLTNGTVTSIGTGAGLIGGPITGSGSIGIANGGVTNAMLANNSITVKAGTGLTGGGTVGLGGTVTLSSTSQGSGTVTSITTGPGLTGGPITAKGTISIPNAGITNAMLATPTITVKPGPGLSGGGTVGLGGTITLTNTEPSSGGTVKSITAGPGLKGGPITGSGTLSLDTAFTDARYMPIGGGGGGLSGVVSVSGLISQPTGTATIKQGYPGGPLDTEASVYNTTLKRGIDYLYRWEAEPTGNNSTNTGATVNLLYGVPGNTLETGLSINRYGIIKFASGQTFPGTAAGISGITAGTGLIGGGSTGNITLSLPKTCAKGQVLVWSGAAWLCGAAGGGITGVTAGTGLIGGGTTGNITLSLPKGCAKGQALLWNGAVWACSNVAAAASTGISGGIAYFSSSSTLVSTAAATNGEILIGSTGKAPVLSTLKAGANVTITDAPGSITISAAGGGAAPILPSFTTGGGNTGGVSNPGINVNSVWGVMLPYEVRTTVITYDVTKADKTANKYDVGIYNNSGELVASTGAIAGTAFAASAGFKTLKWKQADVYLGAGRYYIALTTNCKTNCAQIAAGVNFVSFAIASSGGASSAGLLSNAIHLPADVWGSGNQPMLVIR